MFIAAGLNAPRAEAQTKDTLPWSASRAFAEAGFKKPASGADGPDDGRIWYGKEIMTPVLILDGVAFAISMAGVISGEGKVIASYGFVPLLASTLVGPIIHWKHGHVERGVGSLFLNVGFVFAGVGVAAMAASGCSGGGSYGCMDKAVSLGIITGILGGLGAAAIETSTFSYDGASNTPDKARRPSWTIDVLPILASNHAELKLVGQF